MTIDLQLALRIGCCCVTALSGTMLLLSAMRGDPLAPLWATVGTAFVFVAGYQMAQTFEHRFWVPILKSAQEMIEEQRNEIERLRRED